MLDIKFLINNKDAVKENIKKKFQDDKIPLVDEAAELYTQIMEAKHISEDLRGQRNKLSAQAPALMKEGKKDEAESIKQQGSELKVAGEALKGQMEEAEKLLNQKLCQIPNIPYDEVPEGVGAEDNWVVKSNLKECVIGKDTVGNWTANPVVESARLPHWELAKKYNLIDFDLGVKISGAGFPVYRGKGAQLQRALINFFLDEARKAGYEEIMPPTVVNAASGYGTGQLPDKEGQMYHCEVDDL